MKKNYKILYYPKKLKVELYEILNRFYPKFNTDAFKEKFLRVINDIYAKKFNSRRKYNIEGKRLHSIDYFRKKLGLNTSKAFVKVLVDHLFISKPYPYKNTEDEKKAYSYKIHERWEDKKISLNVHYIKRTDGIIANLVKSDLQEEDNATGIVKYQRSVLNKLTYSEGMYELLKIKYPKLDFKKEKLPEQINLKDNSHREIFNFLYNERYCKRKPEEYSRLYSNLVNTKREYRKFYLLDGRPLQEIDIGGCQIILGAIKIQEYLNAKAGRTLREDELPGDFKEFKNIAIKKDVYLAVAFLAAIEADPDFDGTIQEDWGRDAYKKWFFKYVWYARIQSEEKNFLFSVFESRYPTVAAAINEMKKDNHADFPVQLQDMEANIMLDKIGNILMDKQILFLTIHDCILVNNDEDSEIVKKTIAEVFMKEYGIEPRIAVKKY